jgi:zinc/manganese transport system substrate-binding protein
MLCYIIFGWYAFRTPSVRFCFLPSTPGISMKRFVAALAASLALCASLLAASPARAGASTVNVVAAENFYGDLVKQLGGPHVSVTSILSNPDQDPHLFEASPKTARALAAAQLVVYNGADYDPWMQKLLTASKSAKRTEVVAADLVGKKAGDNPHLWYLPRTMPEVARAVSAFLAQSDPANKADFDARLAKFLDSVKPIDEKIAALKAKYQGVPVTATEPVFGYMAEAIGLTMRNQRFQMAAMNNTEPSATDVAAFERDLKTKQVKVLIYNSQATDASTRRMLKIAKDAGVPTIRVTETEPGGKTYQQWMLDQLNALDKALQGHSE